MKFEAERIDRENEFWSMASLRFVDQKGLHKASQGEAKMPASISDDNWQQFYLQIFSTCTIQGLRLNVP